jgi:hypothetical protein
LASSASGFDTAETIAAALEDGQRSPLHIAADQVDDHIDRVEAILEAGGTEVDDLVGVEAIDVIDVPFDAVAMTRARTMRANCTA